MDALSRLLAGAAKAVRDNAPLIAGVAVGAAGASLYAARRAAAAQRAAEEAEKVKAAEATGVATGGHAGAGEDPTPLGVAAAPAPAAPAGGSGGDPRTPRAGIEVALSPLPVAPPAAASPRRARSPDGRLAHPEPAAPATPAPVPAAPHPITALSARRGPGSAAAVAEPEELAAVPYEDETAGEALGNGYEDDEGGYFDEGEALEEEASVEEEAAMDLTLPSVPEEPDWLEVAADRVPPLAPLLRLVQPAWRSTVALSRGLSPQQVAALVVIAVVTMAACMFLMLQRAALLEGRAGAAAPTTSSASSGGSATPGQPSTTTPLAWVTLGFVAASSVAGAVSGGSGAPAGGAYLTKAAAAGGSSSSLLSKPLVTPSSHARRGITPRKEQPSPYTGGGGGGAGGGAGGRPPRARGLVTPRQPATPGQLAGSRVGVYPSPAMAAATPGGPARGAARHLAARAPSPVAPVEAAPAAVPAEVPSPAAPLAAPAASTASSASGASDPASPAEDAAAAHVAEVPSEAPAEPTPAPAPEAVPAPAAVETAPAPPADDGSAALSAWLRAVDGAHVAKLFLETLALLKAAVAAVDAAVAAGTPPGSALPPLPSSFPAGPTFPSPEVAARYDRDYPSFPPSDVPRLRAALQWRLARALFRVGGLAAAAAAGSAPSVPLPPDARDAKALWEAGQAAANACLAVAPNDADALRYAGILVFKTAKGNKELVMAGYKVKEFTDRAIAVRPADPVLLHIKGRWCYEVASMSWVLRQVATALFGAPPTSSYEEALTFLQKSEAACLAGDAMLANRAIVAACLSALGRKEEAKAWVAKAVAVRSPEDEPDDVAALAKLARQLGVPGP